MFVHSCWCMVLFWFECIGFEFKIHLNSNSLSIVWKRKREKKKGIEKGNPTRRPNPLPPSLSSPAGPLRLPRGPAPTAWPSLSPAHAAQLTSSPLTVRTPAPRPAPPAHHPRASAAATPARLLSLTAGPTSQARLPRLSRPRNVQPRSPPEKLAGFLLGHARRDPRRPL